MRYIFFPILDAEKIEEIEKKNGSIFLILYMIILVKNNTN
jgi:hypothetical protein